jgi:hypothetical protein
MTERSINHSADVSSPMEHTVAEYPVMQGSSPNASRAAVRQTRRA